MKRRRQSDEENLEMDKVYRWYYVRGDAIERFEHGERDGAGISAMWNWNEAKYRTKEERERSLEDNRYKSYSDALDALLKFAASHTGYDWDRMDDDWTPDDGSLAKMLAERWKDFKNHQRTTVGTVRQEKRLRYRSGWICIGDERQTIQGEI